MTAVDTARLPVTSMVRMNRDSTHTAATARASPARKAYRLRNLARKKGTPTRRAALASHITFSARVRAFLASFRAKHSRSVWSSSHSRPQKGTAFWAHRLRNRSGKAPVTV